jgi:hypothetical protein
MCGLDVCSQSTFVEGITCWKSPFPSHENFWRTAASVADEADLIHFLGSVEALLPPVVADMDWRSILDTAAFKNQACLS